MEANTLRDIRDGSEYEHLFSAPLGGDITIVEDATVDDTLRLIQEVVPRDRNDTLRIARVLKADNLDCTCARIWDFVYDHIQYKRDEKFIEQVRRPSRTWRDRKTGVDCDCYSTFISSILFNLGIPHKLRITKYDGKRHYQHIYPVVPRDGNLNRPLRKREDYITMDCVKNAYDDEQAFTDFKDYDMRLDYLNGLEGGIPNIGSVDAQDLADNMEDGELNSKFGNWIKKTTKKVADKVGDGIRAVNRFANPATILLRNGFLLAMKVNLLKVAAKLRYAYLTDEQAKAMNMDMEALKKVRAVKDKAETIYWQAGGLKENLKKAILEGKGNADKKVPMNGLEGLDAAYADQDEYNILRYGTLSAIEGLDELGDPASGTALAAATGAVTALAATLKQIKGLFRKGSPEEAEFEELEPSTEAYMLPQEPEPIIYEVPAAPQTQATTPTIVNKIDFSNQRTAAPALIPPTALTTENVPVAPIAAGTATPTESKPGLFAKAGTWVKENPGKSLLIGALMVGGGYMLLRKKKGQQKPKKGNPEGALNGFNKKARGKKAKSRKQITTIKF